MFLVFMLSFCGVVRYQLHLASRLLQNSFHSTDLEQEAIEVIFGSTESPKLGGARRLRSLLDDFCQAATPLGDNECQIMIRQLNIGIWPAVLHASPVLRVCRSPMQFKQWMESHCASMSARESNLDSRPLPSFDELNVVRPKKLVWNLAASSVEVRNLFSYFLAHADFQFVSLFSCSFVPTNAMSRCDARHFKRSPCWQLTVTNLNGTNYNTPIRRSGREMGALSQR
jgi:hypothetical protein